MKSLDDIARLRNEYEERKRRFAASDVYSAFNRANLFAMHQRQQVTADILKKSGLTRLSGLAILEVGCGGGRVLAEYLGFGAPPEQLYGVDLLFDRLLEAQHMLPGSAFVNADGQALPYASKTFDLILQYTAISSILDLEIRRRICADMLRVLRPAGLILSYDFWLNPMNNQTHGIRPAEIRELFPNCRYEFHRITLAPPLARRLAPISRELCLFLEGLKLLNTHYLVAIRPLTAGS